jgi:hypothetical protein
MQLKLEKLPGAWWHVVHERPPWSPPTMGNQKWSKVAPLHDEVEWQFWQLVGKPAAA